MKKILFSLFMFVSVILNAQSVITIPDKPSGGSIGTAASTVDIGSAFELQQSTASQTLSIPNPSNTSIRKIIYINNTGVTLTLSPGGVLLNHTGVVLKWDGTQWAINGTGNYTIPTTGVGAGSCTSCNLTYQSDGRITVASNGSGGGIVNNQRIGTLFTDNLTSSTPYTQIQTSGSQTFGVGGCTFTGGNNLFTTNLITHNYNTLGTNFENYSISGRFTSTVNSTGSYGIAFGVAQPFSNPSFCVALNTNAAGSRGTLYLINQTTPTVLATSTNVLVYTNGDILEVELKYAFDNITAIVRNITVPTRTESSVTVPNTVTLSFARTVTDRYSQPTIYSLGGTQVVTSFSLSTNEITDPDIILTGDSRVVGLSNITVPKRRYASLFGASIANKVMVWAKGGNTVANLNSMFPEIATQIKGNKKTYIVLFIGVNDAISLNTLATFQTDILSLLQKAEAANMIPILVKVAYVSSGYANAAAINALIAAQNAWLETLSYNIFDENTITTSAGALNGAYTTDGVHLNDLGNAVDAEALKTQLSTIYTHASAFINTGTTNYTYSPTVIGNTQISPIVGGTTEDGVYSRVTTPSASNYLFKSDGTNSTFNAPTGDIRFRIANTSPTGNTDVMEIDGATGNVGIPIVVANQRMFSVAQNTAGVSIGSKVGATSEGAIYFGSGITPSLANWGISGTSGTTLLNVSAAGYIGFYTGNVQRALMTTSNWQFYNTAQTSGNPTQFFFQSSANTAQTAGAGAVLASFDLSPTIQHASNTAVTVDRGFRILAPTYAFASTGGQIADAVTFEVSSAPIQGTNWNAGTPRKWAARLLGNTAIGGSVYIGDATGTTAPTALLTFAAGTATANTSPWKENSGVAQQTVLEAGANNYDGTNRYFSDGTFNYMKPKTLVATSTLDFPSIATMAVEYLTVTLTGAVIGDEVVVGVANASVTSAGTPTGVLILQPWVSAANTITIPAFNTTLSSVDPASGSFKFSVIKR
jgi:lysophospholipase L1-like esterase